MKITHHKPKTESVAIMVRLPKKVHKEIVKRAKKRKETLNGYIILCLDN